MKSWLFWAPLVAALAHIFEEFVFPGGFAAWDREFRPALRASITPRLHVVVNALLVLLCVSVGIDAPTPLGVPMWLAVAALLASNAIFHVVGTIRLRRYSPGVVTGVGLYLPLALYGYSHFLGSGQASAGTAVTAAAIGGSYHAWAALMHARRARQRE
ncbi:MAG: HXXEE domain-containing protein [bacterium]